MLFLVSSLKTCFILCFPEEIMLFIHSVGSTCFSFLITFESFGPFQASISKIQVSQWYEVSISLIQTGEEKESLLMSLLKVRMKCVWFQPLLDFNNFTWESSSRHKSIWNPYDSPVHRTTIVICSGLQIFFCSKGQGKVWEM